MDTGREVALTIEHLNVYKQTGPELLFEHISLQVLCGQVVCLLGPSGCGKTTFLNTIAGFHKAYTGSVCIDSKNSRNEQRKIRRIGYVFQDIALFPHLDVAGNLDFALDRKMKKRERRERVSDLLSMVKLGNVEDKYPSELSGGQQQRVAVARALAAEPDVLLLDEPFSSIDADCTTCIIKEIGQLIEKQKIPSILVTHNLAEAEQLAHHVYAVCDRRINPYAPPISLTAS